MSEWTQVKRGKGKKSTPTTSTRVIFSSAPDKHATVESVSRALSKQRDIWRSDNTRSEVYKILQRLDVSEPPRIQTAVCLAIGSLSRDNLEQGRRSMAQLALFLDIVEYLRSSADHDIVMYAQDPSFTDVDNGVLRSLNITVLEHDLLKAGIGPASEHFGPDAFVAEFFMEQDVKHTRSLLCSETRLLLSSLFWHIDRYKDSQNDRSVGNELQAALDSYYNRYRFPQTTGPNSLAYEGLQFMGRRLHLDDEDG